MSGRGALPMNPGRAVALLMWFGTVIAGSGQPETLQAPIARAQQDIAVATAELNALRDATAAARAPLVQRVEALERQVREQRATADRLREWRTQGEREQRVLTETLQVSSAEAEYVYSALLEYRRSLETRGGPAEPPDLRAGLRAVDELLRPDDDFAALGRSAAALVDLAVSRNRARLGGESFVGACLDAEGRERTGRFVTMGPLAYFADAEGTLAGVVGRRLGSVQPALHASGADVAPTHVAQVASGASAVLPVDASGGDALLLSAARQSWWAHVHSGGAVMVPIIVVGLLAVVLVCWKWLALRRVTTPAPSDLEPIMVCLQAGDRAGAQAMAIALGPPLGEILRDGIGYLDAPPELLEELLHERVMGVLPRLDRHLGALAVLGGVAPLLGLLGTVTGMIHTFQIITLFGSGDTRMLSGGIAEALVTTEAGLVIAIPVVLVHAYFQRRVRAILAGLEQTVVAFMNRLKSTESAA